jgi:hypothetical protein
MYIFKIYYRLQVKKFLRWSLFYYSDDGRLLQRINNFF